MTSRTLPLVLALALFHSTALARSREVSEIDQYCAEVRDELSSATPFIFTGPDPWTELDEAPSEMSDEAIAYVYTQGPSVRWIFLHIVDEQARWQEEIQYYFLADGSTAKRVRRLLSSAANVELEETRYYRGGEVLKENTHHHALVKGAKPSADFTDPDAPEYLSVDELPFPDIPDLWERLA